MESNILQKPAASTLKLPTFWKNLLPLSSVYQHFGQNCCLHLQGTNTLGKRTASVSKVSTFWRYLMSASSRHQHFGGIPSASPKYTHFGGMSYLHLQGTNIFKVPTVCISKVPTLQKKPLPLSSTCQQFGGKSQISNNPLFRSRIWKACNRICKLFTNIEKGNKIIFHMWNVKQAACITKQSPDELN
jgi:hypothetical protein